MQSFDHLLLRRLSLREPALALAALLAPEADAFRGLRLVSRYVTSINPCFPATVAPPCRLRPPPRRGGMPVDRQRRMPERYVRRRAFAQPAADATVYRAAVHSVDPTMCRRYVMTATANPSRRFAPTISMAVASTR